MYYTSKGSKCEWSQNDKKAYCENIHSCVHEKATVTTNFKEYCIDTRNASDAQNACAPFEFRCSSKPFTSDYAKTSNSSNGEIQVAQKETLSKCFCHKIFFKKIRTIHLINCRCYDYEKGTSNKDTNNKKDRKLKRVTARNCIIWPSKDTHKKGQYDCCVTESCIPSCFDSQFQCSSNLYLPTTTSTTTTTATTADTTTAMLSTTAQTTSSPMVFSSQGICASLGIERFAGQAAFVLLYVPLIFILACIIQKCSEIKNVKLGLNESRVKFRETLKKTIHKMKELCKQNEEEPKEENNNTEEKLQN